MLTNYTKRFSIKNYGGISWKWLSGFEQVVRNGSITYYAFDYNVPCIVIFNQYWIYQTYKILPFNYTHTGKYIDGYFYLTSDRYFYKTDLNFTVLNFYQFAAANYKQLFYDSASSKFYAGPSGLKRIDIFNTSCSLLQSINLISYNPYGLAFFNGFMYVGVVNSTQILVLQNGGIINSISVNECTFALNQIVSINFDSYGYMAVSCAISNLVSLYDNNNKYTNYTITTSTLPYATAVDLIGRLIIITRFSLDIYY